ncbi:MAG: SDR family NAD(P)-dependent oxidoreductase [Campylobacteraceae bacterium]|jgi:NADP-dependent 3-hydroxy acid dehydrogenase YdfG|nr:SDR family NAD(P)-dependent oxidoreductase [Campylobacteraceae bacterium]
MSRVKDKWGLITGASSGIGEASAKALAHDGCNLILTARRAEKLKILAQELEKNHNIKVHIYPVDVRVKKSVELLFEDVKATETVPDFLINNAGLALGLESVQEGFTDKWDTMIDTNLKGLLYVTRAFLPLMIQKGEGHIINIGSTAGWQTYPGGNVYNATKFGVRALSDAMNLDLVDTDIKVSCVAPGNCETDFSLVRFDGDKERADKVYAKYKALEAKDVADAILYILNTLPHVNIPYLRIMPKAQRNIYIFKENRPFWL